MIDLFSEKLTNYIVVNSDISQSEIPKLNFAIKTILSEISKFILMFLLFFILNKQYYFLLSFIILGSIRTHSGGIHFYTYKACLAFSLIIFFITSYLVPTFIGKLPLYILMLLSLISLIIIYIKSPIPSKYRRKNKRYNNDKMIFRSKLIASLATIFFITFSFIFLRNTHYINNAIMSICVQALQLLYPSNYEN